LKSRSYRGLLFIIAIGLALSACASEQVLVLSGYQSMIGANNLQRRAAHAGVDFGEMHGAPVLAAADGDVASVSEGISGCGIGVLIAHLPFYRYTVYCHLEKALVRYGQSVKRGETIGLIGTTGNAVNVPHVHLELCTYPCTRGNLDGSLSTEDPLAISAGCFDPKKTYPTDRLVLTHPVPCKD
jgi:murein DD-endopeptidase MepM/ murein hydrolase activator NlpD